MIFFSIPFCSFWIRSCYSLYLSLFRSLRIALPSFFFLLLPVVPCISYFLSSSLLQGLLSTFPYLGSSALVPIYFSFNLSSHHTFHVSFTTARMSTSASCAGPCFSPLFVHSLLVSPSIRPGPVSIPLWLVYLVPPFSTSPYRSPPPPYLCTRLFLPASFLPLLISFTHAYFFIAPLHLQAPSISRFLSLS